MIEDAKKERAVELSEPVGGEMPDGGVVRDISPSENPLHIRLRLRHRLALSLLGAVFTGAFRVLETRPQYT